MLARCAIALSLLFAVTSATAAVPQGSNGWSASSLDQFAVSRFVRANGSGFYLLATCPAKVGLKGNIVLYVQTDAAIPWQTDGNGLYVGDINIANSVTDSGHRSHTSTTDPHVFYVLFGYEDATGNELAPMTNAAFGGPLNILRDPAPVVLRVHTIAFDLAPQQPAFQTLLRKCATAGRLSPN